MHVRHLSILAPVVVTLVTPAAPLGRAAEHGCAWRMLATPHATLTGVAAVSPDDVWAVGRRGTQDERGVLAHWDGERLRLTLLPRGRSLASITALSATNVWAVGDETIHGNLRGLFQRWNGRRWRVFRAIGVTSLSDIAMRSDTSGWAVGGTTDHRPVVLRWNGRVWRRQIFFSRPREGWLSAVALAPGGEAWAVGSQGGERSVNTEDGLTVHRLGREWLIVDADYRDDSDLGYEMSDEYLDVAFGSRGEGWATHVGVVRSDVQHWNGSSWHVERVFGRTIDVQGVIAFPGEVWALGSQSGRPLLLHRDRTSWRALPDALGPVHGSLLTASALSPTMIWAGGARVFAQYAC